MKCFFKILCAAIILPLIINCGIDTADGGGVIVNNPAIAGCIRFPEGQSAYGAMAVIGRQGYSGAIDTNFEANHEGFSISYNIKALDTAYCDVQAISSLKTFFRVIMFWLHRVRKLECLLWQM